MLRLSNLLVYFLRLGATGFGGPIALAGYIQRDLVERRRWITQDEYLEGLALAQLTPGPLAAQLAIYVGWLRFGFVGATLVAVAFIFPSLVMVMGLSSLYVHFGGLEWMQGALYGIGAAVIAIIARSAWKLAGATLGKDELLWNFFVASAVVTAYTESEKVSLLLLCGLVAALVKTGRSMKFFGLAPVWAVTGLGAAAGLDQIGQIFLYFAEAGAVVFGSGLAIVPFLHAGVVNEFHWLTERQFLDAVAVAMITPGPVVITVAFVGYLVAGSVGALAATAGVFLPCYLFVVVPAPYFRRFRHNETLQAFVSGVTAAATGAIAGATLILGRRAIFDSATTLIALLVLLLLWAKKAPEPAVIVGAGVLGVLIARS